MIKQAYCRGLYKVAAGQYDADWGPLDYTKHYLWDNPVGLRDNAYNEQTGLTWGQTRDIATRDYPTQLTPEQRRSVKQDVAAVHKRYNDAQRYEDTVKQQIDKQLQYFKDNPGATTATATPQAEVANAAPAYRQAAYYEAQLRRIKNDIYNINKARFAGKPHDKAKLKSLREAQKALQRQQRAAMVARNRTPESGGHRVAGATALQRNKVREAMAATTARLDKSQASAAQYNEQMAAAAARDNAYVNAQARATRPAANQMRKNRAADAMKRADAAKRRAQQQLAKQRVQARTNSALRTGRLW